MAKKKNDDLFEDLGFEDQDNSTLELLDSDEPDQVEDDLESEDQVELDRRKADYAKLKKTDKIFNNSYNAGSTLVEDEDEIHSYNEIKLDSSSPDYHLYDKEKYIDGIDFKITQVDINKFISTSDEVNLILGPEPAKKKFIKSEINDLFKIILNGVSVGESASVFVSSIHVLDTISALTCMEYKKLFDMLIYDNKEILLIELNKKYSFLDKSSKNLKMF